MGLMTATIEDILPFGSKVNKTKVEFVEILPFIALPLLMKICMVHLAATIGVMVLLGLGVCYIYVQSQKTSFSSLFFQSWTLASGIYLYVLFEFGGLLSITKVENAIVILLVVCACYSLHKMRAIAELELANGSSKIKKYSSELTLNTNYCRICQMEVSDRLFHSIWLGCCITSANFSYFLAGQVFGAASLLIATNIGLTTACHPFLFIGPILLPDNCSAVFDQDKLTVVFVSSLYGVGFMLVILTAVIHQICVYVPKYLKTPAKKNECVPYP